MHSAYELTFPSATLRRIPLCSMPAGVGRLAEVAGNARTTFEQLVSLCLGSRSRLVARRACARRAFACAAAPAPLSVLFGSCISVESGSTVQQ